MDTTEISTETKPMTAAERHYEQHKKAVRAYERRWPEKAREKCKMYRKRLKEERPEGWEAYLKTKRDYYEKVTKPKRQAARLQRPTQPDTATETD